MAQVQHAEPGSICPLMRKDVSKVCHTCAWWTKLSGTHPQTGAAVDLWQCAIVSQFMATLDVGRHAHAGGVATQELRNDIVRREQQSMRILSQHPSVARLIDGTSVPLLETEGT